MGRAARECSEPRERAERVESRLRGDGRRRVGVAAVDPGLEAAANLLARRKQRAVARTARRELHDPHRLVAVTVTARVGRRLVEGAQAIALSPAPGPRGPLLPCRMRAVNPAVRPGSALCARNVKTRTPTRACRTRGPSRCLTRRSTYVPQ